MTDNEAYILAKRITRQSTGITTKVGRTNGRGVVHMIVDRPEYTVTRSGETVTVARVAYSETLVDPHQWDFHELNESRTHIEREYRDGLLEAIANREAI